MRDALGGLVNIAIIAVFMVIVSGYLAFNVNYSKAFRIKNKIISTIESREGLDEEGLRQIKNYENAIGYSINNANMPATSSLPEPDVGEEDWQSPGDFGFYYREIRPEDNGFKSTHYTSRERYYEVITFVVIDIPIIRKIMPNFEFFQIRGASKTIKM